MSVTDGKRDIGLDKPKRNKFDLSKNTHVGVQFGRITPIYCKQVIAGDSFKIKPSYGIRFQPMVYPIASKVHCYTSWYLVPYSTLWKRDSSNRKGGWREFITDANTRIKGGHTSNNYTFNFPWISNTNKSFWSTGSLADYLGIPTTLPKSSNFTFVSPASSYYMGTNRRRSSNNLNSSNFISPRESELLGSPLEITSRLSNWVIKSACGDFTWTSIKGRIPYRDINNSLTIQFTGVAEGTYSGQLFCQIYISNDDSNYESVSTDAIQIATTTVDSNGVGTIDSTSFVEIAKKVNAEVANGNYVRLFFYEPYSVPYTPTFFSGVEVLPTESNYKGFTTCTIAYVEQTEILDAVSIDRCPFMKNGNEASPARPVSALPFRAYEAIYNAYFRRIDIDPYIDPRSGVVNYDTFCDTREGADTNNYDFHYKRLVSDQFTSADPVPVWYDAPIVQIVSDKTQTSNSVSLSITGWNKDPLQQSTYEVKLIDDSPDDIKVTPSLNPHDDIFKILKSSLGKGTGITMRDFQNARAMETYLSACMRIGAGYSKYLEKIHGTSADRDDDFAINIPRYLGGTSTTLNVEQLTQTIETDAKAQGSFIGTATAGDSGQISCYCSEHGIIMGLMSVIPHTADYQRIDNHFNIPVNELSYPNSEFTHLQEQPITYNNMCPVVAYNDEINSHGSLPMSDTFGYNDAWVEYKEDFDDCHGLMRKEYADFVVSRQFASRPSLGTEYITCNPDNLTDPFSVSHKNGDVGICHINLEVEAVRPLPRTTIPKI